MNNRKPITLQELESKKGTKEWDLFWKHIYNVMLSDLLAQERKKLESERKKELAKKKNKR